MNQLPNVTAGQDPQDAIVSGTGKYEDAADKLSQGEKIMQTPKGPDPSPFRNMREASGGR